jgi:hypothetical protein
MEDIMFSCSFLSTGGNGKYERIWTFPPSKLPKNCFF